MTDDALRMQLALRERPGQRKVMRQDWRNLLFLHWRVDEAAVAPLLPAGLRVQTFDGSAWIGLVPFFMRRIRPVWCPPVPHVSNFLELNLRTYAIDGEGRPGVWFFSLDANRRLAVSVARRFFHLPYEHARMSAAVEDGFIDYRSHRRGTPVATASRFRYRGVGAVRTSEPGSLEFFLLERYLLFAHDRRRDRLFTGRVHHVPYPFQDAERPEWDAHLFALDGLARPEGPPDHAAFSAGVDVAVFGLRG